MTHTTVDTERENQGSKDVWYHTINITSLDSAGTETYDPSAELGAEGADRFGIDARAIANDTVVVAWNDTGQELSVRNLGDGSQVADNSSVGHVTLEVVGQ